MGFAWLPLQAMARREFGMRERARLSDCLSNIVPQFFRPDSARMGFVLSLHRQTTRPACGIQALAFLKPKLFIMKIRFTMHNSAQTANM